MTHLKKAELQSRPLKMHNLKIKSLLKKWDAHRTETFKIKHISFVVFLLKLSCEELK